MRKADNRSFWQRSCKGKQRHSETGAKRIAERIRRKEGKATVRAYPCFFADRDEESHWHVGHPMKKPRRVTPFMVTRKRFRRKLNYGRFSLLTRVAA